MTIVRKKLEIFCGTGGVGKTTLAAARAIQLAHGNKNVLLITIDPAKRLKQVMGIDDKKEGEIAKVSLSNFGLAESESVDVVLMNPGATLERVAHKKGNPESLDNPIVKILTRPYGGMNEIMAIIELQFQLESDHYDHIILDTPPGKHFIDFLEASSKINAFFDSSFIELFKLFGPKKEKSPGLFKRLISSGVKKLLGYLEKVTGQGFVEDFVNAIAGIYQNKDVFLSALAFEKDLKKSEFCNWFLVTSQDQIKEEDALELKNSAGKLMHDDNYLIINRSLSQALSTWQTKPNEPLHKLKLAMLDRENRLKGMENERFKDVIEFPEVTPTLPAEQVASLVSNWDSL
mgnify:CR=1 FL=1